MIVSAEVVLFVVILVLLAGHFPCPAERSLVELRLGDATRLAEIGGDLTGRVDLVCTSPPYACEAGVIDKPGARLPPQRYGHQCPDFMDM